MKLSLLIPSLYSLSLTVACTAPAVVAQRADLLGEPAAPSAATRTIVITPDTRWVNVGDGNTVRFVVGDKTFAWNFTVGSTVSSFALNQVAPPGVLDHAVMAYVAPDPFYGSGER